MAGKIRNKKTAKGTVKKTASKKRPVEKKPRIRVKSKKRPAARKSPGSKGGASSKKRPAVGRAKSKRKTSAKKKRSADTAKRRVSSRKAVPKKRTVPKKKHPSRRGPAHRSRGAKRTPVRRSASRKRIHSFIKIKVVGVGGGGGNAVSRMKRQFSVRGVEFIAINTDVQDLEASEAHRKLHIGRALTKGMGAGMNPELGQQAAEENRSEIAEVLKGADMIFLTAGFGGGTGTGASPVIADIAREMGILTVSIVTKPFQFEGAARAKIAEEGVSRVKDRVDTLLVIPNDRIFSIIDKNTSVLKAFEKIDEILKSAVQGVAEVVSSSGLVNVDFADVRTVMASAGVAVIGVGSASGADRAVKAVNQAINSPLLDISVDGARSVLFAVAGRSDLKMAEINEAAKIITENVDPGAKIIFGAYYDRRLKAGQLKIILIAAGFDGMALRREPDSLTLFAEEDELAEEPPPEDETETQEGKTEKKDEKPEKKPVKKEQSDEDIWDIPAFLRKKGRRG